MFNVSKPVFLNNLSEEKNITAFFAANFDCEGSNGYIEISSSGDYRITVNGEFVAHHSSDVFKPICLINKYDISNALSFGLNQIIIEVACYNSDVESFIKAEIFCDGKTVAATGYNFIGFLDTERIPATGPKSEKYSISGSTMVQTSLSIIKLPPAMAEASTKEKKYKIKKPAVLSLYENGICCNKTIKYPVVLKKTDYLQLEFPTVTSGFIITLFKSFINGSFNIITLDETLKETGKIEISCGEGIYERETFNPYQFKYLRIFAENTEVDNIKIRENK